MRYLISIYLLLAGQSMLAQDLALAAPGGNILQPVSGCALSSTENVSVQLFNFGSNLPAGTMFNISYIVNSGAPVTELVVLGSTLLSHSSFSYTFVTQADLSAPANYTIDAFVTLTGDINPTNDRFNGYIVTNSASTVGGSVSADQNFCGTPNSGTLSLSGYTGDIIRWEISEDAGLTWRYVSQTTTQQQFLDLSTTTRYRAVVKNGACGEAISSNATVTIDCIVPLIWMSVNAYRVNNNVELEWQTASEVNTSHFVIERADGDNLFQAIGTVQAQSTSSHYYFTDRNAPVTALLYRIRQVDQDNRYSYSPVQIIRDLNSPSSLTLRENPVKNGILTFEVKGYPVGNAVITIFDMNGKKIQSSGIQLDAGDRTISIPLQKTAAGIYLMTIRSGNLFSQKKFIIY